MSMTHRELRSILKIICKITIVFTISAFSYDNWLKIEVFTYITVTV